MTTSYERLREECNKRLPDRLELKFGCEVSFFDLHPTSPITGIEPMSDGSWEVSWGCFHPALSASKYKILGTPLTITDVLRVLKLCAIDTEGNICQAYGPNFHYKPKYPQTRFNLSLPLSAPENEAACDAVLSIITETV